MYVLFKLLLMHDLYFLKVKIWFQNRRARDRRDKASASNSCDGIKVEGSDERTPERPHPQFLAPTPLPPHSPTDRAIALRPVNQIHGMLQTQWSYLQALHGFYQNYRPFVAPSQLALFSRAPQVSSVLALRQAHPANPHHNLPS